MRNRSNTVLFADSEKPRRQARNIFLIYLFFFYFSGVYQAVVWATGHSGTGLRQAVYMSALWLMPVLVWPRLTRQITAVIGLLLWAASLVTLGYMLVYGQEFSQSVIFTLFESNTAESSEYLQVYFQWWMPLVFTLYTALPVWLWFQLQPARLTAGRRLATVGLCATVTLYPLVMPMLKGAPFADAFDHFTTRLEPATPWQMVIGYAKYRQQLDGVNALLAKNSAAAQLNNLIDHNADKPVTLVLVIGESTNRERMSLYGYGRKTTPNLDAMRNDLMVFDNVITPRPYTIEALQQALIMGQQSHPLVELAQPTLVDLMEQAGYETFWITNQQTMTRRNTMLTFFSAQADHQTYLNNNRTQNAEQYDGAVVAPFQQALAHPARRKFIVVHLLGTHMSYRYRYPPTFDQFTDGAGIPAWVTSDEQAMYNSYDNAVLYNDSVVASLIESFEGADSNGFLLYFSDHGEEVYDDPERAFVGRDEAAPTAAMYTVPFILWRSASWKENNVEIDDECIHRPYSIAYLIDSIADLAGITASTLDTKRSIVNRHFETPTLLVGNPDAPRDVTRYPIQDLLLPTEG